MRGVTLALALLFGSSEVARADEFIGSVTRTAADKMTVVRFSPGYFNYNKKPETPPQVLTLIVADSVKVNKGNFNPKLKRFDAFDVGDPIENGLKNQIFKNAKVMARITTHQDKVVSVLVMWTTPDNEFGAVLQRIAGKSVTFRKVGFPNMFDLGKEETLILANTIKVSKIKHEGGKTLFVPLTDGLANRDLKKADLAVDLVTNDESKIVEIRILDLPRTYRVAVKKTDGKSVTFSKVGGVADEEMTLWVADKLKVRLLTPTNMIELRDGLKNEIFRSNEILRSNEFSVLLIIDEDDRIGVIEIMQK